MSSQVTNSNARPSGERHGTKTAAEPRRRPQRRWLTRLAAMVLAPVVFFLGSEGVLRLCGYGHETAFFLTSADRKGVVPNPEFGLLFFPPALARTPEPALVPMPKPKRTYRIFVFGGSAAQGVPDAAFSVGRILQVMLNESFPGVRFEVVNAAMVAINSHVVLPIVEDCDAYQPDLYLVYMGNNEVVGPHGAGSIFQAWGRPRWLIRASTAIRRTRFGQWFDGVLGRLAGANQEMPREWDGMRMFVDRQVSADSPRLPQVYDNFQANLRDICDAARSADVPLVLSTVLVNLKDCPPFRSRHRNGLSEEQLALWQQHFQKGVALHESKQFAEAVEAFEAAAVIDDAHAELHFRTGQSYLSRGELGQARECFVRARDLDALRFRADTRINEIIREVAEERVGQAVHLVDAERRARLPLDEKDAIPGFELFHEHVHLNFAGNYALAASFFEVVERLLPAEVRTFTQEDVTPPSLEACEQLTTYTEFDRVAALNTMVKITGREPFPVALRNRDATLAQRLSSQWTPQTLDDFAARYRKAVSARPDDAMLGQNYARLEYAIGRYEIACREYRRLMAQFPRYTNWDLDLAKALAKQGKHDEAIRQLRKTITRTPGNFFAHIILAEGMVAKNRRDEAIEVYHSAMALRPESVGVYFDLGKVYHDLGDAKLADEHFGKAVDLAEAQGDPTLAEDLRRRADEYRGLLRPADPNR